MNFKLEPNEITSWKTYPNQYKFYSVHFSLNLDVRTTERKTYDLLDMIENTGGMMEFIYLLFTCASFSFSALRLKALITNRIYWVTESTKELIMKNTKPTAQEPLAKAAEDNWQCETDKTLKENFLHRRYDG